MSGVAQTPILVATEEPVERGPDRVQVGVVKRIIRLCPQHFGQVHKVGGEQRIDGAGGRRTW